MKTQWQHRYADYLCVFALFSLVLVAFGQVIGNEQGLFFRDTSSVFKPLYFAAKETLLDGRIPAHTQWNPNGIPLEQATANGFWMPTSLILLLGEFGIFYDWFVISHFILLALGSYIFARQCLCSPSEAFLAAGVASLAGPCLSLENLLVAAQGLAFIPWMFIALRSVFESPSMKSSAALGLTTGFHLMGLIPPFLFIHIFGFALMYLWLKPQINTKFALSLVFAAVLAVGVAAVDLFPFVIRGLLESTRGRGFTYEEASSWALTLSQTIDLFAPGFWTFPSAPQLSAPRMTPYLVSLYFGSLLTLLIYIVPANLRAKKLTLFGMMVLMLTIAFGATTPIHKIVNQLPLLKSSRFPIKFMIPLSIGFAALSPLLLRSYRKNRPYIIIPIIVQLIMMVSLYSMMQSSSASDYLASQLSARSDYPFPVGFKAKFLPFLAVDEMILSLKHSLLALTALLIISSIGLTKRVHRGFVEWAVVGLILLDLALAGQQTIVGANVREARLPEDMRSMIASPQKRVFTATPFGKRADIPRDTSKSLFHLATISMRKRGEHAFRGVRLLRDIDPDGQSNPWLALGFSLFEKANTTQAQTLLGRLGVGWLSTWYPDRQPNTIKYEIGKEQPQYLVPVELVRNYVRAYPNWRVFDSKQKFDKKSLLQVVTATSSWDQALIFDTESSIATSTSSECRPQVKLIDFSDIGADIKSESSCETVVVLLEVSFPGWKVSIDDAPAKLLNAELGFMGVRVPAGSHQVRFHYEALTPRFLRWSALATVFGIILMLTPRRRKERAST
ncbi:MAG: hypothetical protein VYC39_06305 [Myxococcota bacterium]|nr:hypothetical protein [Myxococcota bacterium]